MRFQVPQFIDRKPKIVGPLTFRQFIIIVLTAAACYFFKVSLPPFFFLMASVTLVGAVGSLTFLKINGQSLEIVFRNFLIFALSSKIFLWKRKVMPPKFVIKKMPKKSEEDIKKKQYILPEIAGRSKLKKLFTQIEVNRTQHG
ncbi:PrgI family protein [Candidatus Parcubacteria bacterium]|nr:PrgI family protein [Candidatus Parcubacteria bacterium]